MRLQYPKTLITGMPGVGKTTLVRRVIERMKPVKAVGFYTAEVKSKGSRVGFELQGFEGERRLLSHTSIGGSHRVGKYGVDTEGFEEFLTGLHMLDSTVELEVVSKPLLTPNCGVVVLLKILTYAHVCCVFSSAHALHLGVI